MFEDFNNRLIGLENFKSAVMESLNDLVDLIGAKYDLLEEKFDKEIYDLKLLIDKKIKDEFKKLEEEFTPKEKKDIKPILIKIQKTDPNLFNNKIKMIEYFERFIRENNYGHDWFTVYKTLK